MARVLLVEDDELQLALRKQILEMAGHEVVTASTRDEADDRCRGCEVIVADLIPGCLEFLREAPAEARVIVLTGSEVGPGLLRADRILKKPRSTKDLLAAIAQLS